MKKYKKDTRTSFLKRFPRLLAGGILLTLVFLTVGVVAGITKQRTKAASHEATNSALTPTAKTVSQTPPAATQTGQIRPLTQEEAQRLAAALKELANQSTDGLKSIHHPDGSVSMDLQGHFQNVALAKRNEDGSITQACVDNPGAGAAFFGIDPELVGLKKAGKTSANTTSSANR